LIGGVFQALFGVFYELPAEMNEGVTQMLIDFDKKFLEVRKVSVDVDECEQVLAL